MEEVIGVVDQDIVCFFLVFEELLDKLLLLCQKLFVKQDAVVFDGGGLVESLAIVLLVHL